MRIVLFGCGAIGGIMAATLTRAGHDVAVVTGNRQIRQAVERDGLRVRELDGQQWSTRPAQVVEDAAELDGGGYELCLLATKTTTLESAVAEAQCLLEEHVPVVCLQNGLPEERAAAVLGSERTLGCVVGWGATLVEPGLSARSSKGGFQLGRHRPAPGVGGDGRDEVLLRVAQVLEGVGPTRIVADLAGVRWSKLAINCATSTIGAVGGDTLGRLLRYRFVRRVALEVFTEVSAVARAAGVRLAKVAGTINIDSLAITGAERRRRLGSAGLLYKHSLLWAIGLKFRRMKSSMLVAIERGRVPEVDWLNGEIVRWGQAHGVDTPVNAALVHLVHDIVERRRVSGLPTLLSLRQAAAQQMLPS